jgi:hypothetical protein
MNEITNGLVLNESYLVPTKAEISAKVNELMDQVDEGWINPMRALGQLTAIEKLVSDCRKAIMEKAITEAEKYKEKTINAFGAEFQIKESGVKYDFSSDAEWKDYQDTIDLAKAQQKGRETVLKAMGMCSKSSTTILQVNLKK